MEAVEAPGGGGRQRWTGNRHTWKSQRSSNAHANHFRLMRNFEEDKTEYVRSVRR